MTAFVLVSGAFTGDRVWREVAGRLRESGAEVHPVALTGTGDRRHLADAGTDLETHVQDVVELLDGVDAAEVVLVGHCYGIHPALGAADRRPERIARIVHLDVGIPQDGDPALKMVPDHTVHARAADAGDWRIAPPAPDEWQRWGSTAGLDEEALEELTRLAAPQPQGTLTRPLRLSGAASALPRTGVLCTLNGATIAAVEMRAGFGDPALRALTDPRASLFELDTGHWPMLSAPGELADVLLRAAAGEGHRMRVSEQPAHLRPFLLDVPERPRERIGQLDLHLPDAEQPRPAVVFVHGGPIPPGAQPTPRDWPAYVGYAQYVANQGAVGVTLDHRLHAITDYGQAAGDLAAAVERVRADPRVDGDRVALWFFSGGGLLSADYLAAPPSWLRCVAASYPLLAPLPSWGLTDSRFHPLDAVRAAGRLPVVLTRVGLESAEFALKVEEFLTAAEDCGADVEVIDVPEAHHAFETVDHTEQSREAVRHAARSVLGHLAV